MTSKWTNKFCWQKMLVWQYLVPDKSKPKKPKKKNHTIYRNNEIRKNRLFPRKHTDKTSDSTLLCVLCLLPFIIYITSYQNNVYLILHIINQSQVETTFQVQKKKLHLKSHSK